MVHLPTYELETLLAAELHDRVLFGFAGAAKVSATRHRVPHLTCPCPAPGCARRFASIDLLHIGQDLVEHEHGQRWSPIVREFVVAAALRDRAAQKAERRAASANRAGASDRKGGMEVQVVDSTMAPMAAEGAGARDSVGVSPTREHHVALPLRPAQTAVGAKGGGGAKGSAVEDEDEDVRVCDLVPASLRLPVASAAGGLPAEPAMPLEPQLVAGSHGAAVESGSDGQRPSTARDGATAADAPAVSSKFNAVAQAVQASAANGERCVVFVDHPLLVAPTVRAIVSSSVEGRAMTASGLLATSSRLTRETAVADLARPTSAGGLDALVLTLRVGAVGLNLACASHVIFASPCLDASLRKQAVGRCHRMGQTRAVKVTTLAMAETVEERALDVMHREDLPCMRCENGDLVTDQYTLRLAALAKWTLG